MLTVTLLAVTLLMRGPVTAVGPLADDIVSTLSISYAAYGVLAALPIVAFGLFSFPAPRAGDAWGLKGAVSAAVAMLLAGSLLRALPFAAALWAGTLLVGAGISFLNVILPVVVKTWFARELGLMMGIYTGVIGLSGSIGGLTAVPAASLFGGYEGTMLLWGVAAGVGLAVWLLGARFEAQGECLEGASERRTRVPLKKKGAMRALTKDPLAWSLTAVMGLQSLLIYTVCAWIPTYWRTTGMGAEETGFWIFVYLVSGLPASILTARFMAWCGRDRWAALLLALAYLFGLWAWTRGGAWLLPGSVAAGASQGAMLSVAFLLMAKKAQDVGRMLAMSGLAQGVGYIGAGAGPWIFGLLFEATDGFLASFVFTGTVIVLWFAAGWMADGREKLR